MERNDKPIDIPKSLQSEEPKLRTNTTLVRGCSDCEICQGGCQFCEVCEDPCMWEEGADECGFSEMPCDVCEAILHCGDCEINEGGPSYTCSISASGDGLKISWSWTASANTWWNIDVDGVMVDYGRGDTSGSGNRTVSSYGNHVVAIYVNYYNGTSDYKTTTVTLKEKTVKCTRNVYYDNVFTSSSDDTGLTPGATYTPSAHVPYYDSTKYHLVSIKYGTTDVTSSSITCPSSDFSVNFYFSSLPAKWNWNASNGSATAAQTRTAYAAVTSQGKLSDFSYLVWNDLCEKVKEVRAASNMTWNNSYATFANTKMTTSNKLMTALRCNSLRYNVNESLSLVSSGGKVYGYYFTEIANAINAWIDYMASR